MDFSENIFQKPIAKNRDLWYNNSVVKSNADVAQLVEQLIRNQQVAGSSPAISSKRKTYPSWVGFPFFAAGTEGIVKPSYKSRLFTYRTSLKKPNAPHMRGVFS